MLLSRLSAARLRNTRITKEVHRYLCETRPVKSTYTPAAISTSTFSPTVDGSQPRQSRYRGRASGIRNVKSIVDKPRRATVDAKGLVAVLFDEASTTRQPVQRRVAPAMPMQVQVIATPTADTAGTVLLLKTASKTYLIGNVPEGTQRSEDKTALRVEQFFITGRTEWRNVGGIMGMLLTMSDVFKAKQASRSEKQERSAKRKAAREQEGKPVGEGSTEPPARLSVWGPPRLAYMIATTRRFIFRKGTPLDIEEVSESTKPASSEPHFSDELVKAWAMPIEPDHDAAASEPVTAAAHEQDHNDMIIKGVVSDMFNSDWMLDALFETKLSEVQLPAALFVRDKETKKIQKYTGPLPGDASPTYDPELIVLARKPWPASRIQELPPTTPSSTAVSYLFQSHDTRGTFQVAKAKALNIKPGPKFGLLTNFQAVENEDGVLITPDQVMDPPQPGKAFAVIDIPNPAYVANLLARPEWKQAAQMDNLTEIYWLCSSAVMQDIRIQAFMTSLGNIKHIISSADTAPNNLVHRSNAVVLTRLAQVDGKRFRTPTHDSWQPAPALSQGTRAKVGQESRIGHKAVVQQEEGLDLDLPAWVTSIPRSIVKSALQATRKVHDDSIALNAWADSIPGANVEITTLGTGSAVPAKHRNVSSTLLRIPGWGNMLLDCGEGTLSQIKRSFAPEEARQIIKDLRMIAISHMHADHHLGTTSVIKAWYELVHNATPAPANAETELQGRLAVVAEPVMHQWLHEYSYVEDYGYSSIAPIVATAGSSDATRLGWFLPRGTLLTDAQKTVTAQDLGLEDLQAVNVKHCAGARAYAITWPGGFKVSYSGDCRPSMGLVRIGKDSTVCIHEATFDDDFREEAQAKGHCTLGEALGVADAMGARACLLTHFSQRYQHGTMLLLNLMRAVGSSRLWAIPPSASQAEYNQPAEESTGNVDLDGIMGYQKRNGRSRSPSKYKVSSGMKVVMGYDMMRFKVGEIPETRYFLPVLAELMARDNMVKLDMAARALQEHNKKIAEKKPGHSDDRNEGDTVNDLLRKDLERFLARPASP